MQRIFIHSHRLCSYSANSARYPVQYSKKDPIYGVSSEKGRLLFRECSTVSGTGIYDTARQRHPGLGYPGKAFSYFHSFSTPY